MGKFRPALSLQTVTVVEVRRTSSHNRICRGKKQRAAGSNHEICKQFLGALGVDKASQFGRERWFIAGERKTPDCSSATKAEIKQLLVNHV